MLPEPERGLSPSGCALIRLFLHSVLVWSSSNADDVESFEIEVCVLKVFLLESVCRTCGLGAS